MNKKLKIICSIFLGCLMFFVSTNNTFSAPPSGCAACRDSNQGCGANGCGDNEMRVCECTSCGCGGCASWSCSCQGSPLCAPSCEPNCGGNSCGPDGCGGSCGSCSTGVCNGGSCCANVAPVAPALSSPVNGTQLRVGVATNLRWLATTSWGTACTNASNRYEVCVSGNQTSCNVVNNASAGTALTYVWTPSTADSYVTWSVRANNGALNTSSITRNVCVEGFNASNTAYVSAWSACGVDTHKRTRTCTETCGTDDCTAFVAANEMEQDCTADIRGTIFDATNLSSCPSFDPSTGYLIGVDTELTANNRTFSMTDQSAVPTHPWALITTPETDSGGNYSVRVYAPATYSYDFSELDDIYIVSSGPKLTCTSAAAVVPGSPTNCATQPCTTVNNMSFGFERYWSGWWQVQGAGVHAETGLKSSIPSSLPTEQSLILPDTAMGNRRGVASYGIEVDRMLGLNDNAKVSTSLWESLSNYDGVIYDYAYFNQQFKKYTSTAWDGISPIVYDDNGNGYQIFKVAGSVSDFNYNPIIGQKVIFLVNGDVTINSNVSVPTGAFLAVLSSGTISFGTAVTNVDGWYLADNISIRCVDANNDSECDRNDVQFLGNGSFVAWGGVSMTRDRGAVANIAGPSEKFTYRMDLYNSAPDPMKMFTKKYKPYVP